MIKQIAKPIGSLRRVYLGSSEGSLLVDQPKATPGINIHLHEVTTLSGPPRPTTPTDSSVRMTKAHIPDCGNDRRPGSDQGSIRGLQLGSALHVPTSPTGKLVGRSGPAYHLTPKVGAEDNDEHRGQLIIHGQPLLPQGVTVPSVMAAGRHYSTYMSSRRDGAYVIMIQPARCHTRFIRI
jgi:hypothetical protein